MQQSYKYLDSLDDSQRAAVEYIDGPSLVIAGAGAGKTRVLTTKVAYLIDSGIDPWNILALTFTNKAAREMRERIANIVGINAARYLQMGTFHSVFSHILRTEAERIGYNPRFTIYDRSDSSSLIKTIIKESGLDDKKYKPNTVLSRISWAKNRLILPESYANDPGLLKSDSAANIPEVRNIYANYQKRLKAAEAMDFDDLLVYMYILLCNNEDIRKKYVERFEFVLVDEYQDTNYTQARILDLLTRERKRICVVGDDAQSIYAFRGADIDNILNFTQTFPTAKLFKLERNYRSTRCIVEAANSVISHNKRRIPKDVYSLAGQGESISVKAAYSDLEEADIVTKQINSVHRHKGVKYSDIAILYRTNAQSRVIEESLRKNGIPYKIIGGLSFYERKEVKDVIAYFRLAVNPDDEEAFRRIINYPTRGIGNTTLTRIMSAATSRGISLWQAACNLTAEELGVTKATAQKINSFVEMMKGFISLLDETDAYSLGLKIIEDSGIKRDINSDNSIENLSKRENIQELLAAINTFVENTIESEGHTKNATLDRYLSEVALLTDADTKQDDSEQVTLMTIHSAKGLEFETVFIVGMEDEIFPGASASFSSKEMEEERRLFYVALTRAKSLCFISYARSRFRYGTTTFSDPSRFLDEIDKTYISSDNNKTLPNRNINYKSLSQNNAEKYANRGLWKKYDKPVFSTVDRTSTNSYFKGTTSLKKVASGIDKSLEESNKLSSARTQSGYIIKPGQIVEHPRFGRGTVISMVDAGDTAKVHIAFENSGDKDLLLKFAPLNVVE